MGNITSVKNALEFLKLPFMIAEKPEDLSLATHIILPGVGAFKEGMKNLEELGFVSALKKEIIENKKSLLGICLGMQLLMSTGEEGGVSAGLNFIAGKTVKIPETGLRIPHVGWNMVEIKNPNNLIDENQDFYFVHSYYVDPINKKTIKATTNYGIDFASVIEQENIFGVQFHPEKSHEAGSEVLKRFSQI